MHHSSSHGTELPKWTARYWAHRLLGGACVGPWTALVTTTAVGLARATHDPRWVPRGERLWAGGLLRAWGVRVDVEASGELEVGRPYVVMSNHSSHIDVAILFVALPIVPGFLAKKELGKIPFLATALYAGGHVLVDRGDRGSGLQAIRAVAREVQAGKTVAIFPEGTRGDGRELLPFKKGAFVIAKRAGAAILPVGIRGSHAVLPRGALLPNPRAVTVRIGAPISSEETAGSSTEELLATVRSRIAELCGPPAAPPEQGLGGSAALDAAG